MMKKLSLGFIGFLQATALTAYCGLIGLLMWRGERWFGPMGNFVGPTFFLVIFVVSALISGLLVLGYPIILFWEKKQRTEAIKLTLFTTAWLVFYVLLVILLLFRVK